MVSVFQIANFTVVVIAAIAMTVLAVNARRRSLSAKVLSKYDHETQRRIRRLLRNPFSSSELIADLRPDDVVAIRAARDAFTRIVVALPLLLAAVSGTTALVQYEKASLLRQSLDDERRFRAAMIDAIRPAPPHGRSSPDLVPFYVDGMLRGLEVRRVPPASFLSRAGVERGNVIVAVDGTSLDSIEEVLKAFKLLIGNPPESTRLLIEGKDRERPVYNP